MPWKPIAYALLCVIVPVIWGLGVYWGSGLIEKALRHRQHHTSGAASLCDDDETLPLEYHI